MIILTDNFNVVPGRMDEALEWAEKIRTASREAGFVGEKNWLLRSIFNAQRFTFATQFASLAEFEEKSPNLKGRAFDALKKEMATGGWLVGTDRAISRILIED